MLLARYIVYEGHMTYALKTQFSGITIAPVLQMISIFQVELLMANLICFHFFFFSGEFIYLENPQQEVMKNNSEHGYQGLYTCLDA